jgi:hypothetical protein
MLLGLAILRVPGGVFEVKRTDYEALVGKGIVLRAGSVPDSFQLVVKDLDEAKSADVHIPGPVGQA